MEMRQGFGIEMEHLRDRDLLVLVVQGVNELKGITLKQDERIRSLENWRWMISGGLAVIVILISVFGSQLVARIH